MISPFIPQQTHVPNIYINCLILKSLRDSSEKLMKNEAMKQERENIFFRL